MSVGYAPAASVSSSERVRRTVALLRRRGYALSPSRLAQICLGGPLAEEELRWAVAACPELVVAGGLVVERDVVSTTAVMRSRIASHGADAPAYVAMARRFIRTLVTVAPFVRSVSIAGSLASGGFRASDDVDLNLIVDDGCRHLAYVAVNLLGLIHALPRRNKPVDDLTRRPLAPRLMTANLILEHSLCFPLARHDEDMAFELLIAEPVIGLEAHREVIEGNPQLLEHFPQLAYKPAPLAIDAARSPVPKFLFPPALDGAARVLGRSAWRYMQWTRRKSPDALARVAYVRSTMRPYTLFDT